MVNETRKEQILSEYHRIFFKDPKLARQLVKKLNYKNDHRLLQLIASTYFDEALFNNDGTNKVPLDRRKLRYAERYITKAFKLSPNCSNVLWTLAKVKDHYGQIDAAIFCYHDILRLGVKGIMRDNCKNDMSVALSQINDSKFELYRLYHRKKTSLSKRYLTLYKKGLKQEISTLYKPLKKYLLPEFIGR